MDYPDIPLSTIAELTAAGLKYEGRENDTRAGAATDIFDAALVRDVDQGSVCYGRLAWVMREAIAATPLTVIPEILSIEQWAVKPDGSSGVVSATMPFTIRRGPFVGWYLHDISDARRERLPLRDSIVNLEAATDWRTAPAPVSVTGLPPNVIINGMSFEPQAPVTTDHANRWALMTAQTELADAVIAALAALGATEAVLRPVREAFALAIMRAAKGVSGGRP
jgi:hypothetical protein